MNLRTGLVGGITALVLCPLTPGRTEMIQPRRLVDSHTAGVLPRAFFDFETRIYPAGDTAIHGSGLYVEVAVGVTDRLNIGLGYGGDGLIGRGKARPNPVPGAHVKYRLIEESFALPALALGYEHQGYGGIREDDDYTGYLYKSQGFFASLSKNYMLLAAMQLGFHGAVNFSLEEIGDVSWPDVSVGLDFALNEELAVAVEYDCALDYRDPDGDTWANPLFGFLNIGIRWRFAEAFYVQFNAKDVLQNNTRLTIDGERERIPWNRELKLVYLSQF